MQAALSIDLESYWHAELLRTQIDRTAVMDRVEEATLPLLALLAQRNVRATFFIVGEVIEAHPALVRQLLADGHEVGCHTHTHRPLWELDVAAFDEELRRFQQALDRAAPGVRPLGFRAPTFSLSPDTAWALDVLAQHGYEYDSSVFPMKTPLYGVPGAPSTPYRPASDLIHERDDAPILEWPMTAWRIGPFVIPVCGGFYLRTLPMPVILHGLRAAARQGPIVVYFHPWELDPATPRFPLSAQNRFITYHNTGRAMQKRLEKLLDAFEFCPMSEALS